MAYGLGLLETAPGQAPPMAASDVVHNQYAADTFFIGTQGLLSVWDFGYEKIIAFEKRKQNTQLLTSPRKCISCLCCSLCFLNKNVEWKTKAQHVALTVDGIHYIHDKHPTMCGLSCTDKGLKSKVVPYSTITTCDVQEPEGKVCCCIKNILSKVRVRIDEASSAKKDDEFVLTGLRHPNAFKQAVFTMKHSELPSGSHEIAFEKLSERNQMLAMLLKKIPNELVTDGGSMLAEA